MKKNEVQRLLINKKGAKQQTEKRCALFWLSY